MVQSVDFFKQKDYSQVPGCDFYSWALFDLYQLVVQLLNSLIWTHNSNLVRYSWHFSGCFKLGILHFKLLDEVFSIDQMPDDFDSFGIDGGDFLVKSVDFLKQDDGPESFFSPLQFKLVGDGLSNDRSLWLSFQFCGFGLPLCGFSPESWQLNIDVGNFSLVDGNLLLEW